MPNIKEAAVFCEVELMKEKKMPRREIGIRGYVGELIVEKWLHHRYSSNEYEIKRQIKRQDSGSSCVDFGVIQKGIMKEIYEVKTQDQRFGEADVKKSINNAFLKAREKPEGPYIIQDESGEHINGTKGTKAFLILLLSPNDAFLKGIGNDIDIVRFKEILDYLKNNEVEVDGGGFIDRFTEDAKKTIEEIKKLSLI